MVWESAPALASRRWKSPERELTARGRRTWRCGSCLCEPVGVAWAWRLQEMRWGRPELSGQAWCYVVALVFPTLPSLHSVMNGFLLVCGHGPSLKSILTKAQNTHPNQPACVLASEYSQPPVHLLQTGSVSHWQIGRSEKND